MKIYKKLENFVGIIPNFSYFFSTNIISYFFSFFFIILFARNYSAQAFGEFTIAQTVFFLFFSISFSNIHYYLNKILSIKFQERRKDIGSCFIITFYSSVFLYFFLAFVLTFIKIDQNFKNVILILNLILLVEPFSIFYSELFVRGQFKRIFKIRFIQTLLFFTLKVYLVLNKFDLIFIAITYVLENLFFSIVIIYYFKKNGNNFSSLLFIKKHTLDIIKKIILFPIMAFAIIVAMRLDILMISKIIGIDASGIYSSASRLIIIILLFGTHFFQFIYPNLNRIMINQKGMKNIYQNLVLFSFYTGIFFFIFSLFFGKIYLNLFGKEFLLAINAFFILSLNVFPALLFNLWIHKQYVISKYNSILFFQIGTICLNILFNFYFINLFGITGAALASLLAPFLSFILINISNNYEFSIIKDSFSLSRHKQAANDVLKIILVNKNPDKFENMKD
jgi:O-antigen/teichoic acid export membrane protein